MPPRLDLGLPSFESLPGKGVSCLLEYAGSGKWENAGWYENRTSVLSLSFGYAVSSNSSDNVLHAEHCQMDHMSSNSWGLVCK